MQNLSVILEGPQPDGSQDQLMGSLTGTSSSLGVPSLLVGAANGTPASPIGGESGQSQSKLYHNKVTYSLQEVRNKKLTTTVAGWPMPWCRDNSMFKPNSITCGVGWTGRAAQHALLLFTCMTTNSTP